MGFGSGRLGVLNTSVLDAACNTAIDPCVAEIGSLVPIPGASQIACFGSGGWSLWAIPESQGHLAAPYLPQVPSEIPGLDLTPLASPASTPLPPPIAPSSSFTVVKLCLHGSIRQPPGTLAYPPLCLPGQSSVTADGVAFDTLRSVYDYGLVAKTDGGCFLASTLNSGF